MGSTSAPSKPIAPFPVALLDDMECLTNILKGAYFLSTMPHRDSRLQHTDMLANVGEQLSVAYELCGRLQKQFGDWHKPSEARFNASSGEAAERAPEPAGTEDKWEKFTPPEPELAPGGICHYDLTMYVDNRGQGTGQNIRITRGEFIELNDHLSHRRRVKLELETVPKGTLDRLEYLGNMICGLWEMAGIDAGKEGLDSTYINEAIHTLLGAAYGYCKNTREGTPGSRRTGRQKLEA